MKKHFALTLVIVAGCCLLCMNQMCLAGAPGLAAVSSASKAPVGWVDRLVQWIKGGGSEVTTSGEGVAGGEKAVEKGGATITKGVATLGLMEIDPCAKAAIVGELYKADLEVVGVATPGGKPAEVTVSGLPPGMKYENGAITGTPSQAGSYSVTVNTKAPDGNMVVNKCLLKTGLKQKLEVVASQWDGANWVPIKTVSAGDIIPDIVYDYDKQRVRFEVRGEGDSGLIGSTFQWKMESATSPKALNVVGIFVPPYDMWMQPDKFGDKAYLMGYVDKGSDSDVGYNWKPYEILEHVKVSVWDEFGNMADLGIGRMKTMSEPFGQCTDAQPLKIVAHTTTAGDKEVLEIGALKKKAPYIFQLEAQGGKESAPTKPFPSYQWSVDLANPLLWTVDPVADMDTSDCCMMGTKNERCQRIAGATGSNDKKDYSDKCIIKIWPTKIPLLPFAGDPEQKVTFTVKNQQCLSWQEKTLSMVAKFPQENVSDLQVYMDVSDIGDTHNSHSILGVYFSTSYNGNWIDMDSDQLPGSAGGTVFHLQNWEGNGDGLKFRDWPMDYVSQNVPITDIKDVSIWMVDGCFGHDSMCQLKSDMDVYVHYVKFHTKYWQFEYGTPGPDNSIGLPDEVSNFANINITPTWSRSSASVENLPGQHGSLEPGTGTQTQEEPPGFNDCPNCQ